MISKAAAIPGLAVAAILLPSILIKPHETVSEPLYAPIGDIRCVLDLGAYEDSTHGLINGYNYYLLDKFAHDYGVEADITAARPGESWLDSLESGSIDAIVLPLHRHSGSDEAAYTIPVDRLTTWAVSIDNITLLKAFDRWLDNYHKSEEYRPVHRAFIRAVGNPFRQAESGTVRSSLSPYDSLIRKYAATLDWDWRLLAAVVFQESRFHIEARSHTGALGLMQLMPRTARRHSDGNMLDPEQNIAAGTDYLKRLTRIFSSRFTDSDEITRYTLAAYHAGEGNVLSSIEEQDMSQHWEYVDTVYDVYDAFCQICP